MAQFIELTNSDNEKILLNKEWVVKVNPYSDGTTMIYVGIPSVRGQNGSVTTSYQVIYVLEDYAYLKAKLM